MQLWVQLLYSLMPLILTIFAHTTKCINYDDNYSQRRYMLDILINIYLVLPSHPLSRFPVELQRYDGTAGMAKSFF